MGLLDGLETLQGAPPSRGAGTSDPPLNDAMANLSTGAKSFFGDFGSSIGDGVDNLGDGVKSSVNSLRRMMGDESVDVDVEMQTTQQMSFSEEMGAMFNLTWFQRIALFAMVFGTGVLMMCISFSFLPVIVVVPHKFAASFTLGNLLAIFSTVILVGPRAQLQAMFHPARAVAAGIYFASLFIALFAAFFGGKLRYIIVLVAVVAEICSCKLT